MSNVGFCHIVGAGPGDPELLTRRGEAVLAKADVVYYDNLANPVLLDLAPPEAERVYVGKQAGQHSVPQSELCELLCKRVREGRIVVRLKGGDPFVFGRGAEEALALADAGLPFDIVPGITSGIAAPTYAGIAVTHRGLATGVTFVTGHERDDSGESTVDWAALAALKHTLCVYMGVGNLECILKALIDGGRCADEPAALIERGSTPRQRSVVATIGTLVDAKEIAGISPPALLIVGHVVELRESIAWFENRPLFGKRILVTRSREQAGALGTRLRTLGADVLEAPLIRIEAVSDSGARERLDRALKALPERTGWVVFTSPNGVERTWQRLDALRLDARAFYQTKIAAVGPATSNALSGHGLKADLVPPKAVASSLLEALQKESREVKGLPMLLLRGDLAHADLPDGLREAGADVEEVTAYCTAPTAGWPEGIAEALREKQIDCIPFTSSSTAANFARLVGDDLAELVKGRNRPLFASIGPVTSATMREIGLPVDAEADPHTLDGLTDAIISLA